jgi:hypothetical protein
VLVVIELTVSSFLSSTGSLLLWEELLDELSIEVTEEIVDLRELPNRLTTALK